MKFNPQTIIVAIVALCYCTLAGINSLCEEKEGIPAYRDLEDRCSSCSSTVCEHVKPTPNECLCFCQALFPNKSFTSKDGHKCPINVIEKERQQEEDSGQEEGKSADFFDGKGIWIITSIFIIIILISIIGVLLFKIYGKSGCKKIKEIQEKQSEPLLKQSAAGKSEDDRGKTDDVNPDLSDASLTESGYNSTPANENQQPNRGESTDDTELKEVCGGQTRANQPSIQPVNNTASSAGLPGPTHRILKQYY